MNDNYYELKSLSLRLFDNISILSLAIFPIFKKTVEMGQFKLGQINKGIL